MGMRMTPFSQSFRENSKCHCFLFSLLTPTHAFLVILTHDITELERQLSGRELAHKDQDLTPSTARKERKRKRERRKRERGGGKEGWSKGGRSQNAQPLAAAYISV
jgi:hypothetical protein